MEDFTCKDKPVNPMGFQNPLLTAWKGRFRDPQDGSCQFSLFLCDAGITQITDCPFFRAEGTMGIILASASALKPIFDWVIDFIIGATSQVKSTITHRFTRRSNSKLGVQLPSRLSVNEPGSDRKSLWIHGNDTSRSEVAMGTGKGLHPARVQDSVAITQDSSPV